MSDELVSVKIPMWLRERLEQIVYDEKRRTRRKLTYAQLLVHCWEGSLGKEQEIRDLPSLVRTDPKTSVFECPTENLPYHEQFEKILCDPEERGGITANLKWGSHTVETKQKVKEA